MRLTRKCALLVLIAVAACAAVGLGADVPLGAEVPLGADVPMGAEVPRDAESQQGAIDRDLMRIALYPIVQAPVGASQGYLIRSSIRTFVTGGEEFAAEMSEGTEGSFEIAVLARYTVLEPGPSGEGRLLVQALVLDGETLRPVARPPWEGVLLLAPSDEVWEDGNWPEWAYEFGVSLDWLRTWMTSPDDAPAHPIGVGERWQALSRFDQERFEELQFKPGVFNVEGEYQGALQPEAGAPLVAYIRETYSGRLETAAPRISAPEWCFDDPDESATMEDYIRWIEECLDAVVAASLPEAMDFEGFHELRLVPGDFPWGGQSFLSGKLTFAIDETLAVTLDFATEAERYDGEWAPGDIEALLPGEPRTGTLGTDSWAGTALGTPTGAPADVYSFRADAGDGVLIRMRSPEFSPYLVLMDEEWNIIRESYDSYDGNEAGILVLLPDTGVYFVQATTLSGRVYGDYTIELEVGPHVAEEHGLSDDDWWGWDDFDWDSDWGPEWDSEWDLEWDSEWNRD